MNGPKYLSLLGICCTAALYLAQCCCIQHDRKIHRGCNVWSSSSKTWFVCWGCIPPDPPLSTNAPNVIALYWPRELDVKRTRASFFSIFLPKLRRRPMSSFSSAPLKSLSSTEPSDCTTAAFVWSRSFVLKKLYLLNFRLLCWSRVTWGLFLTVTHGACPPICPDGLPMEKTCLKKNGHELLCRKSCKTKLREQW